MTLRTGFTTKCSVPVVAVYAGAQADRRIQNTMQALRLRVAVVTDPLIGAAALPSGCQFMTQSFATAGQQQGAGLLERAFQAGEAIRQP
jgi:hypothetical protein